MPVSTQSEAVPSAAKKPSRFKRILIIVAGWAFVGLGVAGLFLPFLQGILFLLIGFVLLSMEYHWAAKLLGRIRARFPATGKWLHKAHAIVGRVFGRSARAGAPHRDADD
jgi:hypothetical protein